MIDSSHTLLTRLLGLLKHICKIHFLLVAVIAYMLFLSDDCLDFGVYLFSVGSGRRIRLNVKLVIQLEYIAIEMSIGVV